MIKKYYYIRFNCIRNERSKSGVCARDESVMCELIDMHPLEYQTSENERLGYGRGKGVTYANGGATYWQDITMLNWQELTEEEYLRFKDHI